MRRLLVVLLTAACIGGCGAVLAQVFPRDPDLQNRISAPIPPPPLARLREQFERRSKQGFEYVELDNSDAYSIKDVIGAR